MKRVVTGLLLLVVLGAVGFLTVGARIADGRMNTVVSTTLPTVSPVASALHRRLFVADMHADQLLWGRDPLERVARGHVDVPRLQEGHVALQVFSVVTKTPRGMNYDHNTGETDNVLLLAIAQRWPRATWTSLRARAVYQSDRLRDAVLRSANTLTLITTREEMAAFVERRAGDPAQVSALLAIEGLHALDGKLESVDTLYAAGFRMMGLTHFFDNEVAASAHGVTHAGLTPLGRQVVARMEALGIIVDLAHSSSQTVQEVLAMATRPVVVSHTGVAATCPGPRNLTDDQLRAIAANALELDARLGAAQLSLIKGDRVILRGDYHYEALFKLVEGLPGLVVKNSAGAIIDTGPALAAGRDFKQDVNQVNASLTYAMQNGIELSIWGRNLTDNRSILQIFDSPAQSGSISGYLSEPRTFGGSVRFKF